MSDPNPPTSGSRPPHREDRDLARRALAGDRTAAHALAARLEVVPKFLFTLNEKAGHYLDREELDDLAQDVLLLLWRKLRLFEGRSTLETWAYGFCDLESRNRRRKVFVRRNRNSGDAALEGVPTEDPPPADGVPPVIVEVQNLGPPQSEVILLRHVEGISFEEIARRLEIPLGTAKTLYYRGLDKLRPRLRSRGEEAR